MGGVWACRIFAPTVPQKNRNFPQGFPLRRVQGNQLSAKEAGKPLLCKTKTTATKKV